MQRWPVVPKPPHSAAVHRQVEVRVIHDDDDVLAAQLQVDLLELGAAFALTVRPTSVDPVNEITPTSGRLDDRVAHVARRRP